MNNSPQMNAVGNEDIEGELLVNGLFGPLYKGRWHNQEVVIKTLSENKPCRYSTLFKNEMTLHKKLSHPNIVQLLHCQYDSENISRCFILLEFISPGDLCKFVASAPSTFNLRIN